MKLIQKNIALLLAVLLIISTLPLGASAETNSVQPVDNSVSTQASDDFFTRATFAQYVVDTLVGVDLTNYTPDSGTTLSDVPAGHENYKAIAWCVEKNCLSASSGNFNPTGYITRAEVAQAIFDLLDLQDRAIELGGDFRDHPNGEAISFAFFTTGVMSAEGGVGFRPDYNAKPSGINADNLPKMLFYQGGKTLSAKAGEYQTYAFSAFTDINGNALSDDDIAALGNINYINSGDSNYLSANCDGNQIVVNTYESVPGKCATLFFYDGNNHVKYMLDVATVAPEWGVYWTKTKNNETFITSASDGALCFNTYADETVYLVPPTGATLSSVSKGEDNSDTYTVEVEDNTVKLTYTGKKDFDGSKRIGFTVEYTEGGQTQTKDVSAEYFGTNKMKCDSLEKVVLSAGESTSAYRLYIDNGRDRRFVRPNEFTLSFTGLTGVTATHKNARVSLSDGGKNSVGTKGQLVATSKANEATFTIDVEIDYPLVGLYSTSTKSDASLIGDSIDLTGNTDDTVTYYFIARDGYTFIEDSLSSYTDLRLVYTLLEDGATVAVAINRKDLVQNGWVQDNSLWLSGRVQDANGRGTWFYKDASVIISSENNGVNGDNGGSNNGGQYGGQCRAGSPRGRQNLPWRRQR